MGTNVAPVSMDDPWRNVLLYLNGDLQDSSSPILLKGNQLNELKIVGPSLAGEDIRIGVAPDGQTPIKVEPSTWVKVSEDGVAEWGLEPEGATGSATLVLFSKAFTGTLEIRCKFFGGDQPWYAHSFFYVVAATWHGPVSHLALVPLTESNSTFYVSLSPTGPLLLNHQVTMVLIGENDPAVVTPNGARTMTETGLMWEIKFNKKMPVSAYVSAPNVPSGTRIGFLPTADDQNKTRHEKSDYPEAVQNLLDSYKA